MASITMTSKANFLLISSAALIFLFLDAGALTAASPVHRPSKCTKCTDADRAQCPTVVPGPNCEVIEEPNCGCCKMCAKKLGEKCGVATGLCETGLECIPPPMTSEEYRDYGPADYFMEAVMGDFICVTRQQFIDILTGVAYEDGDENEEGVYIPELYDPLTGMGLEDNTVHTVEVPDNEQPEKPTEDMSHLNPFIPKIEPVTQSTRPVEPPTAPFQNAPEPCIYHAEKVWGKLHFDPHEWIPSCEKDGHYFPEQCELSYGLERGRCWCVDRDGNPVSKFTPGDEARPELCLPKFKKI
ncbi:insulin-like growth factor-binding protein 5 [Styela clava]|uniref:insulin-like growth factor-binding protein 5 n=1 Tax=Styela clava TaxID=7725 RepID=UPI00193926CD|nr:insulin-like growth factor-binding protein 5 [Styela clava]